MSQRRKGSCQNCAKIFPDLVDGISDTRLHQEVKKRLALRELCHDCFEAYKKTRELCQRAMEKPSGGKEEVAKLLEKLRAKIAAER
ncbi:MAG: hypothetical protein A2289_13970 [Deltaproteobacteria bacterium RIFOXYA12_FULL_58_15]|nr:MAG: hypothetical protein A2289_13970 [Deltaproteobacteria bacterium RIFOXYA12_FULL_58_15]OGR07645.1 MAG: hypothetical protein A2341_21630 [Deltaproteobacteria bacterium RIFOXYB12_FULL_58_9]